MKPATFCFRVRQLIMDSLLRHVFLSGFSATLHLLLLLALFVSFLLKKAGEDLKERFIIDNSKVLCRKPTLLCCLGVFTFNLVLCLLTTFYYYYYSDYYDDHDKLVTLFDLALRTLSWGALSVYLHTQFFNSGEKKYPFLLRVWWGFYFSFSCYGLAVDIKHASPQMQYYLVSDHVVSVFTGLFLCCVGFSRYEREVAIIQEEEPLLNNSDSRPSLLSNSFESKKEFRGGDAVTPYANAGLFSILTLSWIEPLIAVGNKKILDLEDVPQLYSCDSAGGAFPAFRNKLESNGDTAAQVTAFKLVKALIFSTWQGILLTAMLAASITLSSYVGPYLIDAFIQCVDGRGQFKNQGYLLASTFFVAKVVQCLSERHYYFKLQQIGLRLNAVLTTMIYNKGLTLSCQPKEDQTSGEIINLISVDVRKISVFCWYMHDTWLIFLQVGLALSILYKSLGLASVAAFITTPFAMLLNYPLGRLQETIQDKLMQSKDKRMKATKEILRNMRILKLQGWEMKYLSKILELRKVETGWLKKSAYNSVLMTFFSWCTPTFVAVTAFGACMLMGIPLESGKILSALATFKILQQPINNLPDLISTVVETKVSVDRISSFLHLDELRSDVVERLPRGSSDIAIEMIDGNFSWDLSSPNPTLKEINLKLFHGMRVAVCGTVGSGKSSLLSCILGEVPKISGTLKLCGKKAYVAQSPWIQSGTIEENILFGAEMERERYERVLEACALKKDLEILSFGDQTVIGERGINLSGGQKQRIQIARALYQDADIYLFDDPFSAVDAYTGFHLFKEVLLGILSTKTVIYVTHQVEFLPCADLILVMKEGMIMQTGKYNTILKPGSDITELVDAHKAALSTIHSEQPLPVLENEHIDEDDSGMNSIDGIVQIEGNRYLLNDKEDEIAGSKGQLIQEERREKGSIGFAIYWKYITITYGGALVPFILLAQILLQTLQICSNYWMAWAAPVSKDVKPVVTRSTLMLVYISLAIACSFCILARATLLLTAGYKTGTLLFNRMHLCIFRAPMSFFDATPSGRILNRASSDQSTVESKLPRQLASLAFSAIQLLGIIAVTCKVAWQVFIVFIPVIAGSIWYQRYYMPSARELARLLGVCEAPIIQHFSETILGATTIRSFEQQSRFQEKNMKLIDTYSQLDFNSAGAMEWLCFRLDMFSSIIFAFSLVCIVSFPEGIHPAIAGVAVTYGLTMHGILSWMIFNLTNCANEMISAERMLQYTSIPSELPIVIEATRPDLSWPSHGEVDIDNLQARYAPNMPLVLRGLTCTFPGGMKTGIVGRTGSGKSTLVQTLFRIVEPAAGRIMIDGIDISLIGLHDLRSRLSIIPQDPTLFEGTVRSNLDPLEEYTEDQMWEALDKCQLGDEVRKKEKKLDASVTGNGENWSMGQRQLFCLGRVLLKKSKILVLDEATASVDTATDNLIQKTIRQQFLDCTVITIAHRITSILDTDMVLLLSNGLIEEYDSPTRLLANKASSFAQLVAEYTMRSNTN